MVFILLFMLSYLVGNMSVELTVEQRLRDAVAPLKEPLSTDKQHPIDLNWYLFIQAAVSQIN